VPADPFEGLILILVAFVQRTFIAGLDEPVERASIDGSDDFTLRASIDGLDESAQRTSTGRKKRRRKRASKEPVGISL
jgi:hypothetical protein